MNKSKLVLIFLLALESSAFAQLGFQFGLIKTTSETINQNNIYSKGLMGLQLGIIYDKFFSEHLAFNTGLIYSNKRYESYFQREILESNYFAKTKKYINYFEFPFNIKYQKESGFFLKGGPYLAYAYSGKTKTEETANHTQLNGSSSSTFTETEAKLDFGKTSANKAMSYGVNIATGMRFRNIELEFRYSLGLINLSNTKAITNKGNAFNFSATYYFNK